MPFYIGSEEKMKKNKLFFVIASLILASFLTTTTYSQWTYCLGSSALSNLGSYPSITVVDQNTAFVSGGGPGVSPGVIWRTTNGGANFTQIPGTGITLDLFCIWATDANTIYAGDGGGAGGTGGNAHVWKTTNAGTSWTAILSTGGSVGFVNGIVFSRVNPQVGVVESDPPTSGGNYWWELTTNGGSSWTNYNGPTAGTDFASSENAVVCIDGLYWGVGNSYSLTTGGQCKVVFTTNGGTAFNNVSLTGLSGYDFVAAYAMSNDKLHGVAFNAATLPTIEETSNGGTSWYTVSVGAPFTATQFIHAKWINGSNTIYIFADNATTNTSGCCKKSTDGGVTWSFMTTQGLAAGSDMEYALSGGMIYAYVICSDASVLKLSEPIIVGVNNNGQNIPKDYMLGQNYPNPFNPSTNIDYSLPKASDVTLSVFDMLGNKVMTVVNEHQEAGNHNVVVDASKLASGVYFYTLRAGNFVETKRMSLLK